MSGLSIPPTAVPSQLGATAQSFDAGLRAHMLHVYNYLATGIGVSALVAYVMHALMATTTPTAYKIGDGLFLTPFGNYLIQSYWIYVMIVMPLLFIVLLAVASHILTPVRTQIAYWLLVTLIGASTSVFLLLFQFGSAVRILAITAVGFAALSVYGYTTKRDMSGWGTFLQIALCGLIALGVINYFERSSTLEMILSVCGLVLFAAFTAYDTQHIKQTYLESADEPNALKKQAVWGALSLFLDFWNMFLDLLTLVGKKHA